ncbi:MAG: hypothetical protein V3R37_05725 [Rhodospirillales bacterium]
MRTFLYFLTLMTALVLTDSLRAEQIAGTEAQEKVDPNSYTDACFGDRYESDNDINEGNRISDEEIFRILNRPTS